MKGITMTLGRLLLAATLVLGITAAPVSAATVSKSFTTHSQASGNLLVFGGETFTMTVSGTFVGSVKLQKSRNGSDFQDVVGVSTGAAYSVTHNVDAADGARVFYRIYASTHTSGTIVTSLADVDDPVQVIKNNKGVDILTINDDTVVVAGSGLTSASIADSGVVTAKIATAAVITAKLYLDLPTSSVPCVTTAKRLGYCSSLNAATGVCNNCN